MRWLWLMLLLSASAFAGEDCSLLNGTCREACAADEVIENGAFLDCSDKQECCVKKEADRSKDKKIPIDAKDRDLKAKTVK